MRPPLRFADPPRSPNQKRAAFESEVRCIAQDTRSGRKYLACNLSAGGLFVRTLLPLDHGSRLRCTVHLNDGAPPIDAEAEVAWSRRSNATHDKPPGMGLKFLALGQKDVQRIAALIHDE
jgi:uncharacterized protein (TIGR02266 family)